MLDARNGCVANSTTDMALPRGPQLRAVSSKPSSSHLREAGSHHGSAVDHGAFLPHKEPWEQVEKTTIRQHRKLSRLGDLR